MTYSSNDLTTEIKEIITESLSKGSLMPANWIATAILNRYSLPPNLTWPDNDPDRPTDDEAQQRWDFAQLCRWGHVRNAVKDTLRLFNKPEPLLPKQPGFDHLLQGYLTEREDEQTIVPVDEMTDDELEAKAQHYEKMGESCFLHAKEIRRYIVQRRRGKKTS